MLTTELSVSRCHCARRHLFVDGQRESSRCSVRARENASIRGVRRLARARACDRDGEMVERERTGEGEKREIERGRGHGRATRRCERGRKQEKGDEEEYIRW